MKQFLKTITYFSLLGIIPLAILLFSYIYFDPFKVLRDYDDYSYSYINPDLDFISTEVYIKNNPKYHYNSFILGSSRTLAYQPKSWIKHLPEGARPYVFAASNESIYGIYIKLKFLDSLHRKIDNALIIYCRDVTFNKTANESGHLFIKHPATTQESELDFQLAFFKSYLSPVFFINFYTYTITKEFKPHMVGYVENKKVHYNKTTNQVSIVDGENEIRKTPDEYYKKLKDVFYEREGERIDSVQRIQEKQLFMLKEIKRILKKNNTNYKIVLSPLYEQIKFNPQDLAILKELYGDHLYDFSGKNFVSDFKTNYYETSHYRPNMGDSLLNIIYQRRTLNSYLRSYNNQPKLVSGNIKKQLLSTYLYR